MLAPEIHPFSRTRSKASRSSVPAGLTLTSNFGFCFQYQADSSLVLHRPIEIARVIGQMSRRCLFSHESIELIPSIIPSEIANPN